MREIGNTPLIRLKKIIPNLSEKIEIYGKAEWFNPGGSVKDRAAHRIVMDAIENGSFKKGQTLLDSTSGNTGIAYAMLGAEMKFPVELVIPTNISKLRRGTILNYGAKIIDSDPLEGSDGARKIAADLAKKNAKYFFANQYDNPS